MNPDHKSSVSTRSATKISFLVALVAYCASMIVLIDVPYNSLSTGLMSKFYLFKMLFDAGVAALAVMKIYENASGLDHHLHVTTEEGELDIPSFHVPNLWFYGVVLVYVTVMLSQAIDANTESMGLESIWFLVWTAADFLLAIGCVFQIFVAWKIKQRLNTRQAQTGN